MRFPWRFLASVALLMGAWMLVFGLARALGAVPLVLGGVLVVLGGAYLAAFEVALRRRRRAD